MEMPMNQAGTHYTTPSGDIEPATVDHILDLLSKTIDNPNTTVSKGKLKHIASQLLARNAMLERENEVLKVELAKVHRLRQLHPLHQVTELTIDSSNLKPGDIERMEELMRKGTLAEQGLAIKGSLL
jgi:hypothetical protein